MFRQEIFAETINLASSLQDRLLSRGLTIATAESCTGGLLAAVLTERPGSSQVFLGSVVAYANAVKEAILGIDPRLLESDGAVSQRVAEAMAQQVSRLLSTNIGVGITGIAGPDGGSVAKPVGTVWIAVHWDGTTMAKNLGLNGSREEIRCETVRRVLMSLNKIVETGAW